MPQANFNVLRIISTFLSGKMREFSEKSLNLHYRVEQLWKMRCKRLRDNVCQFINHVQKVLWTHDKACKLNVKDNNNNNNNKIKKKRVLIIILTSSLLSSPLYFIIVTQLINTNYSQYGHPNNKLKQ